MSTDEFTGKNLILLFDGTSNEFSERNTNIVKLFSTIKKTEKQLVFYDPGIGTIGPSGWAKVFGEMSKILAMVTGYGISENIKDGYKFLMENFQPGDRIFIYGFSRGAYTARSLGGMIGRVGIMNRSLTSMVDYAYKFYSDSRNHHLASDFKSTYSHECSPYFIGVFDTVGSLAGDWLGKGVGLILLGGLGYWIGESNPWILRLPTEVYTVALAVGLSHMVYQLAWDFVGRQLWKKAALIVIFLIIVIVGYKLGLARPEIFGELTAEHISAMIIFCGLGFLGHIGRFIDKKMIGNNTFHDQTLNPKVKFGLHAIALDEKRWMFKPTLWDEKKAEGQMLRQLWFPGIHVDVGGFYRDNAEISNSPLNWMLRYTEFAGLELNPDFIRYPENVEKKLNKNAWPWILTGPWWRTLPADAKVHRTVRERWDASRKYRPKNLPGRPSEVFDERIDIEIENM